MQEIISLYSPILIGLLCITSAALVAYIIHLELRLRKFMQGKNAESLEDVIKHLSKEHAQMLESDRALTKTTSELQALLRGAIRGVSVVRFNALTGDSSGKQSFAVALLSESGNGVVFSSMYTRDTARVYAKPVKNFASEHELTNEEKQAILEARKGYGAEH